MAKRRHKPKPVAKQNPALLLTGVFGVAGLLASVGAYLLRDSTQQVVKAIVPPVIGGATGYLASESLKLDKTTKMVVTVLGTSLGYVVGNYIEQKKLSESCSGFGALKPSCWWPSLFGSVAKSSTPLHQITDEQRAMLDEAANA